METLSVMIKLIICSTYLAVNDNQKLPRYGYLFVGHGIFQT